MWKNLLLLLAIIAAAAIYDFAQQPVTFNESDVVGTWSTGGMSMMADRNTVTGSLTPSNGNTQKYQFAADGRFTFVGYLQSTMYGCTTDLFNDKQGKYSIDGDQLTLTLSKNFWRNTYSCSPASNKTRNYKLDPETYQLSTKTDEYGNPYICLANDKGETCYRREK